MALLFTQPERAMQDQVYVELVRVLMGGRLPILVMACTVALVMASGQQGAAAPLVNLAGAVILLLLIGRFWLVTDAVRRWRGVPPSVTQARNWEAGYVRVMIGYAVTLGIFNASVIAGGDVAARMLVIAEIFGFSAGQVSRGSARPRLCAALVLMASLPTAASLLTAGVVQPGTREGAAYIAVALLISTYAFSSLETIAFAYRTLVSQLEARRHLASLARLDALTGLSNRLSLRERLQEALLHANTHQGSFALHMIDLDGFKRVNDEHGHPIGDLVLQEVAARLRANLRVGDEAFRLGGDEFAILQSDVSAASEVEFLGRHLVVALRQPFHLRGTMVRLGASNGTVLGLQANDLETLIEHADAALYIAKHAGRGTVRAWTSEARENAMAA